MVPELETFRPHPTEAIVLKLRFGEISHNEVESIFNAIKSQFPDNIVMVIPDDASLESCSKDVLENMISMIAEIIDRL